MAQDCAVELQFGLGLATKQRTRRRPFQMKNIWSRKSLSDLTEEAAGGDSPDGKVTRLRRSLSALNLVALGVGGIVGAGIFVLTGHAAAANAGPAITLSFVLGAVACAFAGLCYAEMASAVPVSGSAYTYAYATIGEISGVLKDVYGEFRDVVAA